MITIPPRDPETDGSDPAFDALQNLHDQIQQAQDLTNLHTAVQKRDALYQSRYGDMAANLEDYGNLHPREFLRQFQAQADEDDRAVLSDSPPSIHGRLEVELARDRTFALDRAFRVYNQQLLANQETALVRDKAFYLDKAAGAITEHERDAYLAALAERDAASAQAGIIHDATAKDAVANIPGDYDAARFTRDLQADPAAAKQNLLEDKYPNLSREQRQALAQAADEVIGRLPGPNQAGGQVNPAFSNDGAPTPGQDASGGIQPNLAQSVYRRFLEPGEENTLPGPHDLADGAPLAPNMALTQAMRQALERFQPGLLQLLSTNDSGSNIDGESPSNGQGGVALSAQEENPAEKRSDLSGERYASAAGKQGAAAEATAGDRENRIAANAPRPSKAATPPPQKSGTAAAGKGGQTVSQRGDYAPISKEEFDGIVNDYMPIVQAHGNDSLDDPKNPFKFTRPVTDYAGRVIEPGAVNIAVANTYGELTDPDRVKDPDISRKARVRGPNGVSKVQITTKITEEGVASEALAIPGTYFNRLDEIKRTDIPEYVRSKYGTVEENVPSSISEIILAQAPSKRGPGIQYEPASGASDKYLYALTGSDKLNMRIYKMAVIAVMATAQEGPWYDFDGFRAVQQTKMKDPRTLQPGEINLGSGNDFMPMKPYGR